MKTSFFTDSSLPWLPRGVLAPNHPGAQSSSIAVQFYNSPDWQQLRAAITTALEPFPEAHESLVRAIRAQETPQDMPYDTPHT